MQTSKDITTAGGKRAYVYQLGNKFEGICTGCGWSVEKIGLAPALSATSGHAGRCRA
ncbi:hypothetical protein [Micromonospora maritima]|uniref:hypothetical protein n=1 Tax=Micromonospora maritima TaxID=986711 RepID=UPI00157CF775|nr:hypothetical protein [Micromonospora maritima]